MSQIKNQLEDVQTGESVLVRCVKAERYKTGLGHIVFDCLPILPYSPHTDTEIIGFPSLHYHFDFRFWTFDLIENFLEEDITGDPEDWGVTILLENEVVGEPYEKVIICERGMSPLNPFYDFIQKMEDHYQNQNLLPENICPHRGYKVFSNLEIVETMTRQPKCAFACPGHGLVFDKNGKMIRRTNPVLENTYDIGNLKD